MRSLQAAGRQARPTRHPFVVHLLHWALLLAFLSGAALQASAQAPVSSQGARNPSAFVTSTRPGPTAQARPENRPERSGGALSRQASQIQQSRASQASIQVSHPPSLVSSSPASSQATASPVAAASNTESMAPVDIPTDSVALSSSLDTRLDAAFGILGATLILLGLALAIAGAAYRRLTCFIVTTYALATITMSLILHFGVEKQIDSPRSGIRVAFVFASLAAGAVGGLGAAIFHRGAKVIIAPVAGFLFGLVLQSVRNDGLIRTIGPRYLLFLGLAGVAFVAGLIPRYFDMVILISTAFLGAFAFAIGVDCFTTAGLKEFLVMNLGFTGIFPRLGGHFSISSIMQIELGMIALVFGISIAVQIRFFNLFEKRMARLFAKTEQSERRRKEEEEAANRIKGVLEGDVEKFEHRYSRRFPFMVPHSLPTAPNQVHFDAKALDFPSLPSHTVSATSTPKTEAAPLLPELNYVSTGGRRSANQGGTASEPAIKASESSKSFFSQMKNFMQTPAGKDVDIPPVPTFITPTASILSDGAAAPNLAKEIEDREQELQKIQTIRQSIDQMRNHLRTQNQDGSGLGSVSSSKTPSLPSRPTSPAVNVPAAIASTPIIPKAVHARRDSRPTAPRPLSQHSLIITQPMVRPAPQAHTRSTSQQTISNNRPRPASSYSQWGLPANDIVIDDSAAQSRRQSTTTITTGRTMSTGSIQQVQRIVTGVMPARPPSQQVFGSGSNGTVNGSQASGMTRTKTMDILDLHAKHRKRLSEIQSTALNGSLASQGLSGPAPATSTQMSTSFSQPNFRTTDASRKRSSTMAGLSNFATAPLEHKKRHSIAVAGGAVDEFGRPAVSPKTGMTPSPTMPASRPAMHSKTSATPGTSAGSAEHSWLSY